ncbi:cytochrome b-c1 complex subunit 7-2, mitochondrial-like [Benincasa hispida]|uniref:cytochrome b-c1 complex subunit 7-2, mitochondrial-like n=1 Tax=Benincasa hispida TaxID=102211 RepID=UPI0019024153|nr:cytochrome b-c1 complex subunit 7-2, mitochondrial-like [Benincasa hispida]
MRQYRRSRFVCRWKSYADVRRKDLEFKTGVKVFLKVAPMKGSFLQTAVIVWLSEFICRISIKEERREIEIESFLQSFIDPKKNWFARQHMKVLTQRLHNYGLRFDLYDPYYDIDMKKALNRLPREVVDAGNQHLKRAMDLSMKHQYLPDDLQAMQTQFRSYLQDMLALVKKERAEREALGAVPIYRGSPNSLKTLTHKCITYPPVSGLNALSDHPSVGEMLY